MKRFVIVLAVLASACGDDTQATDGPPGGDLVGGNHDGGNRDGNNNLLDGPAPIDAPLGDASTFKIDGIGLMCALSGDACKANSDCCFGLICSASLKCIQPPTCSADGAACTVPTDCCSLTCSAGKCGAQCVQNGTACRANGDCCSGFCSSGKCAAVVTGGCTTTGNPCAQATDCCSQNCQGGTCAATGGPCQATGDVCYKDTDCCTLKCNQPNGAGTAGVCALVSGTGTGNCVFDGEPCSGCQSCCSRVCAPTATGGHICQPASGCKLEGDLCYTSNDCCGGPNTGLPGQGEVTCTPIAGTNFGTCHNSTGNEPEGDICNDMTQTTLCGASAQSDCAGCMAPKWQCCKLDPEGIPRCFGGSTTQCPTGYTGQPGCCIAAGDICAFSAECCNGAPCVADSSGTLRCGTMCSEAGQSCRADGDCCVGLVCNIMSGQLQGTCGFPPGTDLSSPADMATTPPDLTGVVVDLKGADLTTVPPDLKANPDTAVPLCSQIGQSCSTTQACCTGLTCTAPSGATCAAGQTGCSCYGIIG